MGRYLVAIALVLAALVGWIVVQRAARAFAARHPHLGAAREEGGSCGSCGGGFADGSETMIAASLPHGPRLHPGVEARAARQGWRDCGLGSCARDKSMTDDEGS